MKRTLVPPDDSMTLWELKFYDLETGKLNIQGAQTITTDTAAASSSSSLATPSMSQPSNDEHRADHAT